MLRSVISVLVFASCAFAAVWPEQLGQYQRKSAKGSEIFGDDRPEWDEFGENAIERGDYGSFQAIAVRFKDATGAYGASLEPGGRVMSRIGNYLVSCSGDCPKDFLKLAEAGLPRVSHGSVPTLDAYLPQKGRVPGTERYIIGPVGLHRNLAEIPASAAAFEFGTEGEIARYRFGPSSAALALFSYPTPAIAREQAPKFQAIAGTEVKRTGPLVVVVLGPSEAAQKLLSEVNYAASVSINETPPLELKPESAGKMLVAIINLAGFVLVFCAVSGLVVGGILSLFRRFGYSGADGTLITLHLSGK